MSRQFTWLRSHSGKYVVCCPDQTSTLEASNYLVDEVGDKITLNAAVKALVMPCPVRPKCSHFIFHLTENKK